MPRRRRLVASRDLPVGAVPEAAKAKTVAGLLAAFAEEGDPGLRVRLARTLLLLDQTQFGRDHPEEAGKAKGADRSGARFACTISVSKTVARRGDTLMTHTTTTRTGGSALTVISFGCLAAQVPWLAYCYAGLAGES